MTHKDQAIIPANASASDQEQDVSDHNTDQQQDEMHWVNCQPFVYPPSCSSKFKHHIFRSQAQIDTQHSTANDTPSAIVCRQLPPPREAKRKTKGEKNVNINVAKDKCREKAKATTKSKTNGLKNLSR